MVTFKKFGRKYTVRGDRAPEAPTRAQKKREAKTARFFGRAAARMDAPPTLPKPSAAYVWATTGKAPGAAAAGAAAAKA